MGVRRRNGGCRSGRARSSFCWRACYDEMTLSEAPRSIWLTRRLNARPGSLLPPLPRNLSGENFVQGDFARPLVALGREVESGRAHDAMPPRADLALGPQSEQDQRSEGGEHDTHRAYLESP